MVHFDRLKDICLCDEVEQSSDWMRGNNYLQSTRRYYYTQLDSLIKEVINVMIDKEGDEVTDTQHAKEWLPYLTLATLQTQNFTPPNREDSEHRIDYLLYYEEVELGKISCLISFSKVETVFTVSSDVKERVKSDAVFENKRGFKLCLN